MSASDPNAPTRELVLIWSGTCGGCGRAIETLVPSTGMENTDAVKYVRCQNCSTITGVTQGADNE